MLDHVFLSVSDIERSIAFYAQSAWAAANTAAQPVGRNSAAYCADRQLKSAEYAIARRRRA
jgi:catechol 2,3-dioxygenase-like lactoylglutathione lyase family enzyme